MEYALIWPYGSQVSRVKLTYKSKISASERPRITSPCDAAQLFRKYWNHVLIKHREEFKCIYLNQRHQVLGISEVGIGDLTSVTVKEGLMFTIACQLSASTLILCHNHPSGFMMPSDADKSVTRRMISFADLVHFNILDHIILSPYYRYYSFVANGLIGCHGNLKYYQKGKEELAKATYADSLVRRAA